MRYDVNYPCYSCDKYYECKREPLFPITYPDPENIKRLSQYGCVIEAEYMKNIDKNLKDRRWGKASNNQELREATNEQIIQL